MKNFYRRPDVATTPLRKFTPLKNLINNSPPSPPRSITANWIRERIIRAACTYLYLRKTLKDPPTVRGRRTGGRTYIIYEMVLRGLDGPVLIIVLKQNGRLGCVGSGLMIDRVSPTVRKGGGPRVRYGRVERIKQRTELRTRTRDRRDTRA